MKRVRDTFLEGEDYDDFAFVAPKPAAAKPAKPVEAPKPANLVEASLKFKPDASFLSDALRDDSFGAVDLWMRKPALNAKHLLVIGASGSGKTTLIKNCGFLEVYDDQDLSDFVAAHGLRSRVPGLIETIESLDASERQCVKKCFTSNSRRLILTSEDAFCEPTKTWAKFCTVVRLEKPSLQFIRSVLKQISTDSTIVDHVATMCNSNLSAAVNYVKCFGMSKASMTLDMPVDVPRATTMLLSGQHVQCLGGSSDISFLAQLHQINVAQATCSIADLAKTFENHSLHDVIDSYHELDAESHWSLVTLMTRQGPKAKPRFEWPKSTKRSEKPKYMYA